MLGNKELPEEIKEAMKRPVAIFGQGVSGQAAAELLQSRGVTCVFYDENSQVFDDQSVKAHDLVIYSPGFEQGHEWIQVARNQGLMCLAELDLGALFWEGRVHAVTGTNGKSTAVTLMAKALEASGEEALACGNIGYPLCRAALESGGAAKTAVVEVSSFQAESLEYFNPETVMITNLAPDHLDRYACMEDYVRAKTQLLKSFTALTHYRGVTVKHLVLGDSVLGYFSEYGIEVPGEYYTPVVELDMNPPGIFACEPQRTNFALVAHWWSLLGYEAEVLWRVAELMEPLAHRYQVIDVQGDVEFINDSKATNHAAALAAVGGTAGRVVWIGGGQCKGEDLEVLARGLVEKVEAAFLIGDVASSLHKLLTSNGLESKVCEGLEEAVVAAAGFARGLGGEGVVLFSPGFASFDMFRNYSERGNFFNKSVFLLKSISEGITNI